MSARDDKPAYRDKHPCDGCGAGYLDCAAAAVVGMKCCKDCAHPTRWSTSPPYTDEEMADMRRSPQEPTDGAC